jgi:hypothetical protein
LNPDLPAPGRPWQTHLGRALAPAFKDGKQPGEPLDLVEHDKTVKPLQGHVLFPTRHPDGHVLTMARQAGQRKKGAACGRAFNSIAGACSNSAVTA